MQAATFYARIINLNKDIFNRVCHLFDVQYHNVNYKFHFGAVDLLVAQLVMDN